MEARSLLCGWESSIHCVLRAAGKALPGNPARPWLVGGLAGRSEAGGPVHCPPRLTAPESCPVHLRGRLEVSNAVGLKRTFTESMSLVPTSLLLLSVHPFVHFFWAPSLEGGARTPPGTLRAGSRDSVAKQQPELVTCCWCCASRERGPRNLILLRDL